MRIAHFIRSTDPTYGGPPACAVNLASALSRRGHEVLFVTADDQGIPGSESGRSVGAVIKTTPWPSQRGLLVGADRERVEWAVRGADFVHLHEVWEVANWQVAKMCRRMSVPFCITAHGSLAPWAMRKSRWRKRIAMRGPAGDALRAAAFIHFTAEAERAYSQPRTGNPRSLVAPNIIDMTAYRDLPGIGLARGALQSDVPEPLLLFMSRICRGKGLEHVIRAMPGVRRRFPKAVLAVAGSGDPLLIAEMKREAERLRLGDAVRFLGFVSGPLKSSLLQACDLFVLPSDHENFGNALFEAAACGARLLISDGVATWKELVAARAALVVERTPESIVKAVEAEMSVSPDSRSETSAHIRSWTMGFFEGPKIVQQYEDAYSGARTSEGIGGV